MITEFQGKYRFLSNFWPATIYIFTDKYPTVEHAYQASKTLDTKLREEIRSAQSPGKAKRLGGKLSLRKDWELVKVNVMRELVRQKFVNHPELGKLLLETWDQEIQEGNKWGDTFWGVCNGKGRNELGKILMDLRLWLKERQPDCESRTS